jgi:hypothetical protein
MNDLIDMVASEQSPVEISDKIKELLMQKAVEKIEMVKPTVVSGMFDLESNQEEE